MLSAAWLLARRVNVNARLGGFMTAAISGETILALSIDDAAKTINLSRSKLYQLMCNGSIRSITVGRRRLIERRELERFLARHRDERRATSGGPNAA